MVRYRGAPWVLAPLHAAAALLCGALVVFWPLAVFHGPARWVVLAVWSGGVFAVFVLFAAAGAARRRPRPRRPTR